MYAPVMRANIKRDDKRLGGDVVGICGMWSAAELVSYEEKNVSELARPPGMFCAYKSSQLIHFARSSS